MGWDGSRMGWDGSRWDGVVVGANGLVGHKSREGMENIYLEAVEGRLAQRAPYSIVFYSFVLGPSLFFCSCFLRFPRQDTFLRKIPPVLARSPVLRCRSDRASYFGLAAYDIRRQQRNAAPSVYNIVHIHM